MIEKERETETGRDTHTEGRESTSDGNNVSFITLSEPAEGAGDSEEAPSFRTFPYTDIVGSPYS